MMLTRNVVKLLQWWETIFMLMCLTNRSLAAVAVSMDHLVIHVLEDFTIHV